MKSIKNQSEWIILDFIKNLIYLPTINLLMDEKTAESGSNEGISDISRRVLLFVASIIYPLVLVIIIVLSKGNPAVVFLGMFPFLCHVISFFLFLRDKKILYKAMWISPLFFSAIFYFVWLLGNIPYVQKIDGPQLVILNIVVSYLINAFF